MIFNTPQPGDYYTPMDKEYIASFSTAPLSPYSSGTYLEKPIIPAREIGQTVTEGRQFGTFRDSVVAAIRAGAAQVELATQMEGTDRNVGAEAYGKEAREELREIARANKLQFTSVHSPTQVGNLSGFNKQQGFVDEQRKAFVEEVKKAVKFSGDVSGGGAVVVHTGEYERPISDAEWARNPDGSYKFLGYNEEPHRATIWMVDERTGRVIADVKKSQILYEPIYKTADSNYVDSKGVQVNSGDWVDKDGNWIDQMDPDQLFERVPEWNPDMTRFNTRRLTWRDFEERARLWNERNAELVAKNPHLRKTPEEMFFRSQMETQILQYRGSSLYHGKYYEGHRENVGRIRKALDFYEKLEKTMPEDEKWKLMYSTGHLMHLGELPGVAPKTVSIPDYLRDMLRKEMHEMRYTHEASASADSMAAEREETLKYVVPVQKYAKDKSFESYAELGIYAMDQSSENPNTKKDIFIAPENIFPEMGFGSHPQEMIELVEGARRKMVQWLTAEKIPSPHGERDEEGKPKIIDNPFRRPGMTKEQAEEEAKQHIRATFDTQHLGMWWKHFTTLPGETEEQKRERFNKWYMEQVEDMQKKDIIGHIHVVDSLGGGHHHLPAGQGDLPIKTALHYLKEKGFLGTMVSEAHGEPTRILTKTWEHFGSPIYSGIGPFPAGRIPQRWADVQHSYFGNTMPPNYIFGAYSPSNDWQLWSQVPME